MKSKLLLIIVMVSGLGMVSAIGAAAQLHLVRNVVDDLTAADSTVVVDDPDLGGEDLSDTDLGDTDLDGADLGGEDLSDTDLGDTDLDGMDLSSEDLSGAGGTEDLGGEEFFDDWDFIADDGFADEEYFDPSETTFDEWFGSDELVDWDGDGAFSQEDYDLLVWLTGEATAEDVDGDGFLDEEDYGLFKWLGGSADSDFNGDGVVDDWDFTLYQQDVQGFFFNEIYYVYAESDHRSATISWYSSEPGSSDTLRYKPADSEDWQAVHVSSSGYEHQITLTGLKAGTAYDFKARSLSADGLLSEWVQDTFETRGRADIRPVVIADLDIQVTEDAAILTWFTNRLTDARYTLSLAGKVVAQGVEDEEGELAHEIYLDKLVAGSEYTYTLSSTPADEENLVAEGLVAKGQLTAQQSGSFNTSKQAGELEFIDPPFSVVSSNSAVIEVALNQSAAVRVDYGRADNILEKTTSGTKVNLYKEQISSAQQLSQHSLTLTGLKAQTTYRYRVTALSPQGDSLSTDPYGSQQWSHDWQFTTAAGSDTLPPVIVEGPRVFVRDKLAVVEWSTDVETTGKVFIGTQGGTYGTSDEFAFVDRAPGGAPIYAYRHEVTLTALDAATAYAYRIESTAANNKTVVFSPTTAAGKTARTMQPPGGAGTFTTNNDPDTQFPVILSGPTVTGKSRGKAVVEWTTDEPANSVAKFGKSQLDGTVRSGEHGLRHKLVLTNLEAGISYKFVVNSTDPLGNGATQSATAYFTTDPDLDLKAPVLSAGPAVVYKNDRSAAIRWTTDEEATGQLFFGTTDKLGTVRSLDQTGQVHEVSLTNLTPATKYYYKVSSSDLSNNGPTSSQVLSFTTEAQPDLSSPVVSGETAVPADSLAILRWTTDELSDSFAEFGTSEALLGEKVGDDKDLISHEVVLTHLKPATKYFYRVGSVDRAGNPAGYSRVLSFTTLASADLTAPGVPAGLKAQAGEGQASLSWTASTDADLAGYNLYRRVSGGSFAPVATRLNQTSYMDLGLLNGQAYEYQLTAIDRARSPNESQPSGAVLVTPSPANAPSAPTQLGQEGELFSPTLKFTNATPHTQGAALSYIIQVAADSAFRSVVASVSGLSEGSGGVGTGRTAWTVNKKLQENQTYYWRVRAVEGVINGPFSESRQFKTQRPAAALVGDFNGDKTVNFDDFFLFADNFGKSATGEAARFDLSKNKTVDFDDFFLFADNFGKSISAKRWAAEAAVEQEATLELEAVASGAGGEMVVEISAAQAGSLQAFGLVLSYDPRLAQFQEAQPGGLVVEEGLFAVLHQEPGELVLGGSLRGGQQGPLAQLRFTLSGPVEQVAIEVGEALVSRPGGRVSRVERVAGARLRPAAFFLAANYPNPFNPSTAIRYGLAQGGMVRLSIYDLLGQRIAVLAEGEQQAGFYQVVWNGNDAAGRPVGSGVYFYLLQTPQFTQAHRMALIK
ncbi:MAG: fibronectin type III domain-containing protein [Candidatus Handelsmanbacteria bacterium]|nr:fibronectin type III domain-containing protein [Candidatus Handelsmanbacteria bacterium]